MSVYDEVKNRPDNKTRQEAYETSTGDYGGEGSVNDELRLKTLPNTES